MRCAAHAFLPPYLLPPPPPPKMKQDMFPSERREAKALNFSIAYGKTEPGLAKVCPGRPG